jgi:hypothetical protein
LRLHVLGNPTPPKSGHTHGSSVYRSHLPSLGARSVPEVQFLFAQKRLPNFEARRTTLPGKLRHVMFVGGSVEHPCGFLLVLEVTKEVMLALVLDFCSPLIRVLAPVSFRVLSAAFWVPSDLIHKLKLR